MKISRKNHFDSENISMRFLEQNDVCLHSHDFFEFVYVVSGSILHTLNGKNRRLESGDYFFIDIGDEHCYSAKKYGNANIINCLFLPTFIDGSLAGVKKFSNLMSNYLIKLGNAPLKSKPSGVIYHDNDGYVGRIYEKMLFEFNAKQTGYEEIIRCYLIEIIILTVRKVLESSAENKEIRISDKIIAYIDKHYAENVTLEYLAEKYNYSESYLSRIFKDETGQSFVKYMQKVRIEQSCRLLANTDKSVYDIMCGVGYRDIKFFTKIFKESIGTTPAEFRKRIKNDHIN